MYVSVQIGLRYSNSYSYSHSYCYCNSQSKCYCHCYSYSAASGAAPAGTRGERKRFFLRGAEGERHPYKLEQE